jgi:predicted nucleotidyltransferase component of viral defense system
MDIEKWVDEAASDWVAFRQAVHIILHAITIDDYLYLNMIMKGGMLLGIEHDSSRFTTDIDFSTAQTIQEISEPDFLKHLNDALIVATSELPYTLECSVQSCKLQPRKEARFPSLKLKVGYANSQDARAMKRLRGRNSPTVVKIDYSLNEKSYETEERYISEDDGFIKIYALIDIMAEKFRSIIQQIIRHRARRQDVYDLWYLIEKYDFTDEEREKILNSFKQKCQERVPDEYVQQDTLGREEIIKASAHEYADLRDEVEELPEFEETYSKVREFYENLPW